MTIYIALQNTYTALEIGLFKNNNLIHFAREDKIRASKNCIPLVHELLIQGGYLLSDIAFIAANQGPGPFTTLRVVIASANGLSFGSNIPLLGVDGLDAMLTEHQDGTIDGTLILLNAFNNDVYFALKTQESLEKGYANIHILLARLQQLPINQFQCLGNGILLYESLIKEMLGSRALITPELPEVPSLESIGILGFDAWQKKRGISKQLLPLYLKQSM